MKTEITSINMNFLHHWTHHALVRWDQRFAGINRDIEFSSAKRISKKTRTKIKKLTPISSEIYLNSTFKGRFCLLGRSNIVFVIDSDTSSIITVFHLYGDE